MTLLKHLSIQNIILIDRVDIPFEQGFNVLSGETGSGKSAILEALGLIAGERADTAAIRRGEDKGIVEAIIEWDSCSEEKELLQEAGIDCEEGQPLIIRREISVSGKGRVFINHQSAQVSFLKRLGEKFFNIVGQHANQRLMSTEHQRQWVDIFGSLEWLARQFSTNWTKELDLRKELDNIIQQEAQRLREVEVCRRELEELHEAQLQEGEEEEIFTEYTLLANADELTQKITEITSGLCAESKGILATLNRHRVQLDQISRLAPGLTETAEAYQNAQMELQEIAYTLNRFLTGIENNPQRMQYIEERLALFNRLKRKYGNTITEIQAYQEQVTVRLNTLERADERIEELRKEIETLHTSNNQLAEKLTSSRKQTAKQLSKAIVEQLCSLNMPKVEFEIDIVPQPRSKTGDDHVEFFLIPNVGEHRVSIRECASGGELSRLMLGLQTLLSGKEKTPIVIFDEIDANIGGATATIVGDKMRTIGLKHQVLCVTHFPQVAKHADHHIQIYKSERSGRTYTEVSILDSTARQHELSRMAGG